MDLFIRDTSFGHVGCCLPEMLHRSCGQNLSRIDTLHDKPKPNSPYCSRIGEWRSCNRKQNVVSNGTRNVKCQYVLQLEHKNKLAISQSLTSIVPIYQQLEIRLPSIYFDRHVKLIKRIFHYVVSIYRVSFSLFQYFPVQGERTQSRKVDQC